MGTRLPFCVLFPMLHAFILLCLVLNVTRVYRFVSLCPMLPVSIFLCLVPKCYQCLSVSCAQCYPWLLSVSYAQCYPCLSLCVYVPNVTTGFSLCLVSNERYTRVTLNSRHRKKDTCNIGHKTKKDRHV
jgi:hypothetical protein